MNLFRVLSTAATTGAAALAVSFLLLVATAGLAGRGTARLDWLLPLHCLALIATFAAATIAFHRRTGPWLAAPSWHWAATCLHAAFGLLALLAAGFVTLVVLNR